MNLLIKIESIYVIIYRKIQDGYLHDDRKLHVAKEQLTSHVHATVKDQISSSEICAYQNSVYVLVCAVRLVYHCHFWGYCEEEDIENINKVSRTAELK